MYWNHQIYFYLHCLNAKSLEIDLMPIGMPPPPICAAAALKLLSGEMQISSHANHLGRR